MYSYFVLFLVLIGFISESLNGQTRSEDSYPQSYFHKPLDLPVSLNADFGDIRENHFHSGLDFSTLGKTGFRVMAAASGYVSRIKVQAGGYGQALYITHPDGLVTVYGHLSSYAGAIGAYLLRMQYLHQTYEVDLHLQPDELPVQSNELIALSGNSGFSGGPHLHFEIRDELTEEIINPLLFNLPVRDHLPPIISGVYLYRSYQYKGLTRLLPLHYYPAYPSGRGRYQLHSALIRETGALILGIVTDDLQDGNLHRHGVYSIRLLRNEVQLYESTLSRFRFDQTRAVNSYLDYRLLKEKGLKVQRSFIEPGNSIPLYEKENKQRLPALYLNSLYRMEYQVRDVAGNLSILDFQISAGQPDSLKNGTLRILKVMNNEFSNPLGGTFPLIRYDRDTVIFYNQAGVACLEAQAQCMLRFQAGSLFDNQVVPVSFSALPGHEPGYRVGKASIAVKDSVLLGIRPPSGKNLLAGNWVLVGDDRSCVNTVTENGFLKAWITYFGTYHLSQDSLPPVIIPLRQPPGTFKPGSKMAFTIRDDLSGIGSYRGEIDGTWELFRYDAKTHLLWHTFTQTPSAGNHSLRLVVTDKVGNSKELITNF